MELAKSNSCSLANWISDSTSAPTDVKHFAGLDGLGKALFVSRVFKKSEAPVVVVLADKAPAHSLVDNLNFFLGGQNARRVHYLGPTEFDYHRSILPDSEDVALRNVVLSHALENKPDIFVTTTQALLQRVVSKKTFERAQIALAPNDEIERDELLARLVQAGYQRQPVAYDPGVFSARGGVVDIFCPLYSQPIRIEFYGDFIDEIRFFDPQTQRSLEKQERVTVVPFGLALIPPPDLFAKAAESIKQRLDEQGISKADRDDIINKVQEGRLSAQNLYLFPLFCEGSESIGSYLPKEATYVWDSIEEIRGESLDRELMRLNNHHVLFEEEPIPIADYESLFLRREEFLEFCQNKKSLFFEDFVTNQKDQALTIQCQSVSLAREREEQRKSSHEALANVAQRIKEWLDLGYRVHVVSHTRTHCERTQILLDPYGVHSTIHEETELPFEAILKSEPHVLHLWQGYLSASAVFSELQLVLISEEEIFGKKKRVSKSKNWSEDRGGLARALNSFRDLKMGDYIVHRDHGVGRYLGLQSRNFQGMPNDYVLLEYRDGDKLYIPVYRLNVIQKYMGGEGGAVGVDKLGGERWAKVKKKAEKAVQALAQEFLKIHATRKLVPAHSFPEPGTEYQEFEMEFPFDETPDQQKAIDEVNVDLGNSYPMDRLLVGDVGYGKTEVAMRAAHRSVLGGKQVAVLVPTTVLAFQHYQTFKSRFKNIAAEIEMVCRLRTATENRLTIEKVKQGKIDVIVGTHRLLSNDVSFRDLGLVVIDEEHRFGVVHKEKLKKLCKSVHLISMTATPIPRTLNMAMTGIKDISLITTPPPDRLSVRTFVSRDSDEVIVEAISNELGRGGQVFFVHNRIQSIYKVQERLLKLFPKVSMEVVHGQMDPSQLEKKMLGFHHNDFQILLTTAIIESGVDIPRVNTIIIDRADAFGLAQLYQLRGRVGRADRRAYCYLLIPGENAITEDAKERLQVIQRHTDLGAGFNIASHDMEIRGAGDLLGKEQSGHLNAIGVDMYFDLLEEAIRHLKGEAKKVEVEPEINLKVAAYFPNDYLPDVSERIVLYRRLSEVESDDEVAQVEEELRDRFGALPPEVINLLGLMKIKLYLKKLHVTHMNCGPKRASLQFADTTPVTPDAVIKLIKKQSNKYSLTPDHKLVFSVEDTSWQALLKNVQQLCDKFKI